MAFETATIIRGYQTGCEDRLEVFDLEDGRIVFALADGSGGVSGGGQAADMVMDKIRNSLSNIPNGNPSFWTMMLADLDTAILDETGTGESTAVVISISNGIISGASIGDSEAWLVSSAGHINLTSKQRRKPLLGTGEAFPVPFGADIKEHTLLLGSDGLFKYSSSKLICQHTLNQNLTAATNNLVDLITLQSGNLQDDIAIGLCRQSKQ